MHFSNALTPILGFIFSMAVSDAWAIDGAALQRGPRGFWHLVLPSEMQSSLRDSAPEFQAWPDSMYSKAVRKKFPYTEHAAPFALIADLNGDGFEDVVLDGHDRRCAVVLVVVSRGNRYRVVEARRDEYRRAQPRGGLRGEMGTVRPTQVRTIWWENDPFVPSRANQFDYRGTSGFQYSDSTGVSYTLRVQ